MPAAGIQETTATPLQTVLRRVDVLSAAVEDLYAKVAAVTILLADDETDREALDAQCRVLADLTVSRRFHDMVAKARARSPQALDAYILAQKEAQRAQPWIAPRGTRGSSKNQGQVQR